MTSLHERLAYLMWSRSLGMANIARNIARRAETMTKFDRRSHRRGNLTQMEFPGHFGQQELWRIWTEAYLSLGTVVLKKVAEGQADTGPATSVDGVQSRASAGTGIVVRYVDIVGRRRVSLGAGHHEKKTTWQRSLTGLEDRKKTSRWNSHKHLGSAGLMADHTDPALLSRSKSRGAGVSKGG